MINLIESWKMATSTLVANKLRSSLTMLGIIIGNASVISLVGIAQGVQKLAEDEFQSLGPNVLFVIPGSREARNTVFDLPKTLVLEDAEAIASQVSAASQVSPQLNSREVINYRNQNLNTLVLGVTPIFPEVRSFNLDQGRFFNEIDLQRNNRVTVIGSDIAERFFPGESPLGKQLRINNISWQIIGVMESKGSFLGENQDEIVYLPLTTMANQVVGNTSPYGLQVSVISVAVKDNKVSAAQFQIENLLRLRHKIVGEDDFYVQSQKDILDVIGTITQGLTLMLGAISGISLLVGGIGVMNIMLVSVTERTNEIGLRKAIGATKEDILLQFLIEATILAAMGGIVGTIIGISGLLVIGAFSPLTIIISPTVILIAVGVSGGIGLFFGVVPARQAANLDPIVALRSA